MSCRRTIVVLAVLFAAASGALADAGGGLTKPTAATQRPRPAGAAASLMTKAPKHLFGADDRIDLYQETGPERRAWAEATCALVMAFRVKDNENGTFELLTSPWREEGVPACPEEPFGDQPFAAFCSAFLIAPDLVATAGHCPESGGFFDAEDIGIWARVVFGYAMENADTPITNVDSLQVYTPIEIVAHSWTSTHDYAVLRLDRPVTISEPLVVRTAGVAPVGTPIGAIGHPSGLPLKLAFGADSVVLDNQGPGILATNLDVYPGNSGSPVLNAETGVVEGIISTAIPEADFVVQGGCFLSTVFSETEEGQGVTQARFLPTGAEAPPPNDDCASALPIAYGAVCNGVTFAATTDGYTDCAPDSGADVWHVFTPTMTGEVLISTEGSAFDSVLSVYEGCGGEEAACNDDAGNQRAKLILPVTAGMPYHIRVAGYDGQSGHYRLSVGPPPEPALEILDMVADGWDDVTGIDGAMDITLSPDGRNAYVTGVRSLAVFDRDAETGSLSFVEAHYDGMAGVDGLNGGYSVVVSPDGHHIYATGEWDDAVAVFARDAATGRLTSVQVSRHAMLDSATGLAISPDGNQLYVASKLADSVSVLRREPGTGRLTLVESHTDNLDGARDVALSPDGRHVYATAGLDDTLVVFERDATTGRLTHQQAVAGILDAPSGLALSPDGVSLYVASCNDNAVATFHREPATGLLTFLGMVTGSTGGAEALAGVRSVTVSPDGLRVYAASEEGGALVTFARDPDTGYLTHVGSDIVLLNQHGGAFHGNGVTVSPDARHVYVASWDGTVSTYRGNSLSEATIVPTSAPPFTADLDTVSLTLIGQTYPPYQWYRDDIPLTDTPRITGTQTDTLTFSPVLLEDAAAYHATHTTADDLTVQTENYELTVHEPIRVPASTRAILLALTTALGILGSYKLRRRPSVQ